MKIAVLTSGGDSQGMNLVLKAVLDKCKADKIEIYKVSRGYEGLIGNLISPFTYYDMHGSENDGGSALGVSRCPRFLEEKYQKIAIDNLKNLGIDNVIVIGGNGSFKGSTKLIQAGINVIALPGTIDNDLNFDMTLGYDSAVNNAVKAIDNIMDCANSIECGIVVKVMGRECGDLAEYVGRAVNAEYVITNKTTIDYDHIANTINEYVKIGIKAPIVIVQEFVEDIEFLSKVLAEKCNKRFKTQDLGYIQRGGRPSAYDRAYGYALGVEAVEHIKRGEVNTALGMIDGQIRAQGIEESLKVKSAII